MRAFIAIDLAPMVCEALEGLATHVAGQMGGSVATVRWTPVGQLHLTLHFLGDLANDNARAALRAVTMPWSRSPFQARLGGAGLFPARGPARVVWLGIEEGESEIGAVHDEAGRRLRTAGLAIESRPFRPHVTVARLRQTRPALARRVAAAVSGFGVLPSWSIDRVRLYESRLTADGAVHAVLGEGQLVGHPTAGRR